MTSFEQHLVRQMVFSKSTWGPGARTLGVLDHLKKEIEEVEQSNGSAVEWVDVAILALDGLTRQLWASSEYSQSADSVAATAVNMIIGKQGRNEVRTWPSWHDSDPDKAMERVVPKDAARAALDYAKDSQYDGDHHKMWVIDQMVRQITGDQYDAWVKEFEEANLTTWDTGIAP